ncbi:unnamed protein product [Gongylonema pulchrum]|uniref:Protein kinase domain-containing protein n=1 Tax=Gongylonema pulchrum TaxID=637853 RepID=A0A183F1B3_9BILA|nr:unnamed protein product [Gongylonema pulchrum]
MEPGVPLASRTCLALLQQLIVYDPKKRCSAETALRDDFFIGDDPNQAPYTPPPLNTKISHRSNFLELDFSSSLERCLCGHGEH